MKTCTKCLEHKELTEFHNSAKSLSGKKSACKSCAKIYNDVWNKENKTRKTLNNKWSHKRRKYDMSQEDYEFLLKGQDNCCAICGINPEQNLHNHLYVDHDHKTNKVRGLLCKNCNTMLGMAKDNITTLTKGAEYLTKNM